MNKNHAFQVAYFSLYSLSRYNSFVHREETEVDVEISLGGDDKMVGMGDLTGTAVMKSPIRRIKLCEEKEETAACALPTGKIH